MNDQERLDQMTTQMLIYQSAVPVSASRHGKHSIQAEGDYSFARNVNSMPLTAVEFLPAAQEYPVVFAGDGANVTPAVILGVRDNQNVFVGAGGTWSAKYIPAFARRYPFVFSTTDEGKTFTLCIDESFPGLNAEGRGQRLFNDEGKPTQYVDNVLNFLQQFQVEFRRTRMFCNRLKELDLFEPMQAQVNLGDGGRLSLSGFMAVNRAKLKALPAETLAELMKNDSLELIYAHLHSMNHFEAIRKRMVEAAVPAVAPQTAAADETAGTSSTDEARKPAAKPEKESGGGRKRGSS